MKDARQEKRWREESKAAKIAIAEKNAIDAAALEAVLPIALEFFLT